MVTVLFERRKKNPWNLSTCFSFTGHSVTCGYTMYVRFKAQNNFYHILTSNNNNYCDVFNMFILYIKILNNCLKINQYIGKKKNPILSSFGPI